MSDPLSPLPGLGQAAAAVDYPRTTRLQGVDTANQAEARETKLKKAGQDFESLFLGYLLKCMRATVPKGEKSQFGMETMREISDEQLAIHLAQHGGIGLGDMLVRSLKREESLADAAGEQRHSGQLHPPERAREPDHEPKLYPLSRVSQPFHSLPVRPAQKNTEPDTDH